MNELTIVRRNSGAYIDSRDVAVFIGKDHRNLLRDIRGYCEILNKSNELRFELINFFVESSYIDSRGRRKLCYLLTKQGCELCANKLSGAKGVLFTAAYVAKFNEMEAAEREAAIKAYAKPRLSEFNSAVKNVLSGMSQALIAPDDVMKFLSGVYNPLGIKVSEDGHTPCYYTVTDIAQVNGIYSESGRPHSHAVSAIISKLNIHESQMVVVPYGLVGVTFRYDIDVMCAVGDWITKNGYPSEVPHLNFDYHIYYKRDKAGLIRDGFFINLYDDDDFDDADLDGYTAEELDAMCGKFGDCDDCPGFLACCEMD